MGFIIGRKDGERCSGPTSTSTTTNTMNEELRFSREVQVDDVVQGGDVDTTRGYISYYQNTNLLLDELGCVDFAGRGVQARVDERAGNSSSSENL